MAGGSGPSTDFYGSLPLSHHGHRRPFADLPNCPFILRKLARSRVMKEFSDGLLIKREGTRSLLCMVGTEFELNQSFVISGIYS